MNNLLDLNEVYKYTKAKPLPLTSQVESGPALKLTSKTLDLIINDGRIDNITELANFFEIKENSNEIYLKSIQAFKNILRIEHKGTTSKQLTLEFLHNCEVIEEIYALNTNIQTNYILQNEVILQHNILHIKAAHNRYVMNVSINKNASYTSKFINLYCQQLQIIATIDLKGLEANNTNHILNYATDHNNIDVLLTIAHHCSYTVSKTTAHAIAQAQASSSILGKIYVAPNIEQINADLQIKNLLDSKLATCNSRPQLEIYSNDVKCSHGSTTGGLNTEALYYMQSRGIDLAIAKNLLRSAFIKGIMEHIHLTELKAHIYNILNLTID